MICHLSLFCFVILVVFCSLQMCYAQKVTFWKKIGVIVSNKCKAGFILVFRISVR
ncbi:unnamed protein product [Tenebrio molitor]|nr:unnamed protein product [Tenebrio molitor]